MVTIDKEVSVELDFSGEELAYLLDKDIEAEGLQIWHIKWHKSYSDFVEFMKTRVWFKWFSNGAYWGALWLNRHDRLQKNDLAAFQSLKCYLCSVKESQFKNE